jgi:hypothetical protein
VSRLPEKGEAEAAMAAMNERSRIALGVTSDQPTVILGSLSGSRSSGLSGSALESLRLSYGDLFDIGELLIEGGAGAVEHFGVLVRAGQISLEAALASVLLQGVGTGVLMERARWEKRDAA